MTTGAVVGDGIIKLMVFGIYLLISLPTIAIAIASFVIGSNNLNVDCDNASFWTLPSWLITSNIILLLFSVIGIILYCTLVCFTIRMNDDTYIKRLRLIKGLLNLPFNVIGCIILFSYSSTCAGSLWAISLTTLILQWISIVLALITIIYIIYERKYDRQLF